MPQMKGRAPKSPETGSQVFVFQKREAELRDGEPGLPPEDERDPRDEEDDERREEPRPRAEAEVARLARRGAGLLRHRALLSIRAVRA